MADSIGIALLAAGKGTRLKVDIAKPLLPMLGQVMMDFVVESIEGFLSEFSLKGHIGAVVGHQKEKVEQALSKYSNVSTAWQKEQKGTADALKSYFNDTHEAWNKDYTLVICADTPLITSQLLIELYNRLKADSTMNAVCATFETEDPTGYGRIVRADKGFKIVEHKDADEKTREIKEVNSGLYLIKTSYIKEHLDSIGSNNASNEFYLTDLFKEGENVYPVLFKDAVAFSGVNTLVQWQEVQKELQQRKLESLMLEGVFVHDLNSTYVDWSVQVGSGSEIYAGVSLLGNTKIADNVVIENNSFIKNSTVSSGAKILAMSHLEEAEVGSNAAIGPYARLRPKAQIGEESKIGNFVEIKKAILHKGVKVSHLSYVGDAEIGSESNIGCGFITCNYDGANKHKTNIGSGTFIGSDVQAIAPVNIGDKAFVAAGSTITNDVPDGGFAIARQKQATKPDMAKRFLKTKKDS